MSQPRRAMRVAWTLGWVALVLICAWWILPPPAAPSVAQKPPPAAQVDHVVKEDDLNKITLTAEAEQRIGLATATVQRKPVQRIRVYGGEVTVPIGQSIVVSAPLGGALQAPSDGLLRVGQKVRAGTTVLLLSPWLTPDARATLSAALAEADGQVTAAETQVELTRIALERSRTVLKEGAGSQRQVDEALAAHQLATKSLNAVTIRQSILQNVVGGAEAGAVKPIPLTAPSDGILKSLSALPGQTVPSGAALFEVTDLTVVWVRVPLPVVDLEEMDRTAEANVGRLSAPPGAALESARPVDAPPSADPIAATVDCYYELPNAAGKFAPGQRLGVWIPLSDQREGLTVPWSAIVFDIQGGTWVYEQLGPRQFVRRRVTVAYTLGSDAVLDHGPDVGTRVVSVGVQQLFAAETGFVK